MEFPGTQQRHRVQSCSPSFILLEVASEILSRFNIFRFGTLVTISEKNYQHLASLLKINLVARATVDPKLRDT